MSINEDINLRINTQTGGSMASIAGITKGVAALTAAWIGLGAAKDVLQDAINIAADYEANMVSLNAVAKATGRDINKIYSEMETHIGGIASKASVAETFLKGMTTELSVDQISDMTQAVKDASIAMGEDFNTQLPLITKALKQLNPAILDNIGVTVRLDQVNKRIREGFYGMGTAINEATQQHAIFTEIMKQTAKFAGQEEAFLGTTKGQMQLLSAAADDLLVAFGQVFIELGLIEIFRGLIVAARGLADAFSFVRESIHDFGVEAGETLTAYIGKLDEATKSTETFGESVGESIGAGAEFAWDGLGQLEQVLRATSKGIWDFSGMVGDAIVAAGGALATFDTYAFFGGLADGFAEWGRASNKAATETDAVAESVEDLTDEVVALQNTWAGIPPIEIQDVIDEDELEAATEALRNFNRFYVADQRQTQEAVNSIQALAFETRLDLLSDYEAEKAIIEQEARDRELEYRIAVINGAEEDAQLLNDIEAAKNEQLAELDQVRIDDAIDRARYMLESIMGNFEDFAVNVLTATGSFTENFNNLVSSIGRSIVRALVHEGVTALTKWIVKSALATKETAVQTAATVLATKSKIALAAATVSLTAATSGVAAASAASAAAMAPEMGAVLAMTKAYIALAAAKAAATLGLSSPASIAAAATTKAELMAVLIGFDDPKNDAAAYRHGQDYGDFFMSGLATKLSSPNFGSSVAEELAASIGKPAEPLGGGTIIHIHFEGPVTSESFIDDEVIPRITEAITNDATRLAMDDNNLTGDSINAVA